MTYLILFTQRLFHKEEINLESLTNIYIISLPALQKKIKNHRSKALHAVYQPPITLSFWIQWIQKFSRTSQGAFVLSGTSQDPKTMMETIVAKSRLFRWSQWDL